MEQKILYMKLEKDVEITGEDFFLKDLGTLYCKDNTYVNKCNCLKIGNLKTGSSRKIVSVMKIIEMITDRYPELQIENIGETDVVVERIERDREKKWKEILKICFVSAISFFGTAFTIMAFHNDIGLTEVFEKYYMQIMGRSKPQFSELELSYTIGIATGILIFFNHLGKKKFSQDPTPIQVEMIKFKQDMDTTLLENATKKGHTQDVS